MSRESGVTAIGFITILPQKKKWFYSGCLAKFMYLKRCNILKIDLLTEFFKLDGQLYKTLELFMKMKF